jgi:preprotein translocase subunit YajC
VTFPCPLADLADYLRCGALLAQAAPAAAQPEGPGILLQMLPIFVIFALFYFLMMRPAQRDRDQRETMLSALKKNDRVVTQGGLVGVVTAIRPDVGIVTLRTHEDTKIDVIRSSIARILTDEPAEKPENT